MRKPGFRHTNIALLLGGAIAVAGLIAPWVRVSVAETGELPGRVYNIGGTADSAGGWVATALLITMGVFALLALATKNQRADRTAGVVALVALLWGIYRWVDLRGDVAEVARPEFGSDARLAIGLALFVGGTALAALAGAVSGSRGRRHRIAGESVPYDDVSA